MTVREARMPILSIDPRKAWVDDRCFAKYRPCLMCQSDFWSNAAADRFCSGCRKKVNEMPSPKTVLTPVIEEVVRDC